MDQRPARTGILDIIAGVLLVLEAVLMAAVTTLYASYALLDAGGQRFLWGAAVVSAIITAGIAVVAWGFWKRRRFANGGAFAWQLLQGAAGVWLLGTQPTLSLALIAAAITVAIAVMRRVSVLSRDQSQP